MYPFISVIVPTYRRPSQLAACLSALAAQTYPRDCFEVLVVDDGSGAPPRAVVAAAAPELTVSLLVQRHAGAGAARNTGAAHARGAYLALTDDDCAPAPTWLAALARHLAAAPDCLIGGRTLNALPTNPYSAASQSLIAYLYSAWRFLPAWFFASNNLTMSAARFRAMGGFHAAWPLEAAAEDREFCDRWQYAGHRLAYAPDAVVYHAHALTLASFCLQHFRYGRGAYYVHRAHAQRHATPLRIGPPRFYLGLLRYPWRTMHGVAAGRLTGLLALSQMANALGFLREALAPTATLPRSHTTLLTPPAALQ